MEFLAGNVLTADDLESIASDTGWVVMTTPTDWTQASAYRKVGNTVIVQVTLTRTGANFTGGISVGLVPADMWPTRAIYDQALSSTAPSAPVRLSCSTLGSVTVDSVTVNTGNNLTGQLVWQV